MRTKYIYRQVHSKIMQINSIVQKMYYRIALLYLNYTLTLAQAQSKCLGVWILVHVIR